MKWGVYARDCVRGACDFVAGISRNGHSAQLRSLSDFSRSCVEAFDVVIVFGLQGKGEEIFKTYKAIGVPVWVVDYGYLKRANNIHDWATGHWQVSLNGLNKLPRFFDSSRLDALDIKHMIAEKGGNPEGYNLLCVQTSNDKSHGLNFDQLKAWVHDCVNIIPNTLLRLHPQERHLDYGTQLCPAESLQQALNGAKLVITGNSNVGHDALFHGVPAVAFFEGAAWSDLSNEKLPEMKQRIAHFERCAWGQYTWDEIQKGIPLEPMLAEMLAQA